MACVVRNSSVLLLQSIFRPFFGLKGLVAHRGWRRGRLASMTIGISRSCGCTIRVPPVEKRRALMSHVGHTTFTMIPDRWRGRCRALLCCDAIHAGVHPTRCEARGRGRCVTCDRFGGVLVSIPFFLVERRQSSTRGKRFRRCSVAVVVNAPFATPTTAATPYAHVYITKRQKATQGNSDA